MVTQDAQNEEDREYDEELGSGYPNSSSDEPDARGTLPPMDTSLANGPSLVPGSPTDRFIPQDDGGGAFSDRRHLHDMTGPQHIGSSLPHIYLDKPVWPLKDLSEAMLFRHFVEKLAIWVR